MHTNALTDDRLTRSSGYQMSNPHLIGRAVPGFGTAVAFIQNKLGVKAVSHGATSKALPETKRNPKDHFKYRVEEQ